MIISLDCETTGFDFNFGARPFFVTTCDFKGNQTFWEWDVDPFARQVRIPSDDLKGIARLIRDADRLILQNAKFDVAALRFAGIMDFPWDKVEDTLIAGHVLASNQPHNLTDMAMQYLHEDIEPHEKRLKQAVNEARRLVRSAYPDWAIAKEDRPDMPSAHGEPWKMDMWLPRCVAVRERYRKPSLKCKHTTMFEGREIDAWGTNWICCECLGHRFHIVLQEYSNPDSSITGLIWREQEELLKEQDLWEIYRESMKLPPVIGSMEYRGVTYNKERSRQLSTEYAQESIHYGQVCTGIAESYGYELELPKSGNNKSLSNFVFDVLKLEPFKVSEKTLNPSLDKECMLHYEESLPTGSKQLTFIKSLLAKRANDTAIGYLASYDKFCVPTNVKDWYRIFPSVNQTGTDTTRSSSSNPNEQSISKKKDFNLRWCFGPTPDREFFTADANNLEMVIPAFESKEEELIELFTHPEKPPYFGSYHLMIFDTLHPKWFKEHGAAVKDHKDFKSTWYKYVKNGNFAKLYGGQPNTVDRAYHVVGGYEMVDRRLPRIAALNDKMIAMANKLGYVETIPDKSVNPRRGYPLMCTRTEWSKVLPTVPLNYHVQGTGGWWKRKAMVRVHEFFQSLNAGEKFAGKKWPGNYYIIMDIHDELAFDAPRRASREYNYPIMREVKRLMELGGEDIGIPITVSVEQHEDSWAVGLSI